MAPLTGFEEGVASPDSCSTTGGTSQGAGGMTCPTNHPHLANGVVTGRAGHVGSVDVGAVCMHAAQTNDDAGEFSNEGFDVDPIGPRVTSEDEGALDAPSAPPPSIKWCTLVCTTVDIPNSKESAYQACDRNEPLDLGFQEHLQEGCEAGDINTFLALPEIIPTRQRRRQQPLLDFTKSKILTSHMYIESCEHVLAQKEATQAEAKRKAELREATKETRRREKEEHQVSSEGSSKCQKIRESPFLGREETMRHESESQRQCACDVGKPSPNPGRRGVRGRPRAAPALPVRRTQHFRHFSSAERHRAPRLLRSPRIPCTSPAANTLAARLLPTIPPFWNNPQTPVCDATHVPTPSPLSPQR